MEQIVANPVTQILDGVQHVPRQRVQNLVRKQMVDVPVPQILLKSWSLLLVRSSATLVQASGDITGGRAQTELQEQSVEVIKVIPQEQCQ